MKISHLNEAQLKSLVEFENGTAVSIYMPTHRTGPETRQDPIRFKNLRNKAQEQLEDLNSADGNSILEPAESIPEDVATPFWRNGADGLALFLAKDFSRCYKLPIDLPELTVVADKFHIKPLLEYVQGEGSYYVLAVSQNKVRLFTGSKHSLVELEADSLPEDLQDALNIDEYQSTLQWHTAQYEARNRSAGGEAMYHGQGAGEDDKKKELLQFFHRLDQALVNFLTNQTTPLVFAGVEYLFPIYQEANNYRGLAEKAVTGNPDDLSAEELHQPAWEIVKPQFTATRTEVVENFGLSASQGKASADLIDALPAACQGRVDKLLIAKGKHRWGTVDPATGEAKFCKENTAEACDLVDYAAARTLQHGGQAYLLEEEEMPAPGEVAAIFRF